jgi:RHS repeat-associated protein
MNYIITRAYQQATSTPLVAPSPEQAQVQITYFDGLGRPMQQIANQQSATGKDIVTPIEYDSFGRQPKDYLPFVGSSRNMAYDSNSIGGNLNYYTSTYSTSIGFSEKLLEKSPLNRVLEQAAPGDDWRLSNPDKHTIQLGYQTNTADEVQRFDVSLTADYVPSITANANYAVGELYKTVTTDENGHSTEEFKDKEGRVVLKRNYDTSVAHDTYYVYDVYGNLTYVLPPKAEGTISATVLDELCYQYQYDYRNRLVAKKLPGKQWEYMVYDKLDRVVATGPAFSPFSDVTGAGWLITKYDVFNRVVYTGWLNSPATSSARSTMQQAQTNATTINENKQASGTIDGIAVNYSNNVAPTTFKLLTVNYYDTYAIPNLSGLATSVEGQTVATATKGLATGSWTRVPTTTAEVKAETNYVLYDTKYRTIRTYTTNYLGGFTCTDSKLDSFSGQLQYTVQKHKRTGYDTELTVKEAFTYSAQNRLLTHTHQINGGAEQLLADNTYDELGKLTSKKVGNTSALPLQKVDYSYNVRGWLTQINEIKALQKGTDPKDLFGFTINYNTVDGSASAASPLYNGNIAETFWQFGDDGDLVYRGYGYKYDSLNRLKDASYQRPGFNNPVPKSYDENLTYDKNGNIMTLKRNGDADDQLNLFTIDDLSYEYLANSNKLMRVSEAQPTATSSFKDGNTSGDDYDYDANGNLIKDKNKSITTPITYNHLNLPTKIIFPTGNIVYIYTASGQKMQKILTEGASITTTDYLGGYQYQNTVLQFFPTAEGYVKNTPVSGTNAYSYVYNYTDHLGNVRLSYTKNPSTNVLTILEENSYYPFGMKHTISNAVVQGQDYKYKYNGKELQDELGLNVYDYGARQYMPDLGRWMQSDPLINDLDFTFNPNDVDEDDATQVEIAYHTTLGNGGGIYNRDNLNPYTYGYNDPVRFDDPDGRCPNCFTAVAGFLVGGGIELGGQLLSGKSLSEVDWADVGVESVKGALIGSGVGAGAAAALEGGSIVAKASFDYSKKDGNQNVLNGKKSITKAVVDGVVDAAAGKAGGAIGKKIGNLTEGGVKAATKAETKATKNLVNATNKFNKATDGGRNMTSSAVNKLEKAKGGAQVARGNTVRAQMVNSATKGAAGETVNKAAQNSIGDKIKNFFGF